MSITEMQKVRAWWDGLSPESQDVLLRMIMYMDNSDLKEFFVIQNARQEYVEIDDDILDRELGFDEAESRCEDR